MDAALHAHSLVADGLKALHRSCVLYANALCHVVHAVDAAKPNNVLDIDVIAYECLDVVIDVDNAYKTVAVQSEIIKEG